LPDGFAALTRNQARRPTLAVTPLHTIRASSRPTGGIARLVPTGRRGRGMASSAFARS